MGLPTVTELIESKLTLHPVQRFVVKLLYGIPLETRYRGIFIRPSPNLAPSLLFTERDYLTYLFDHKMCNVSEERPEGYQTLALAAGRRSGKSLIQKTIATCEFLRLLAIPDPHSYYGIPLNNSITIGMVGSFGSSAVSYQETIVSVKKYCTAAQSSWSHRSNDFSVKTESGGKVILGPRSYFSQLLNGVRHMTLCFDDLACNDGGRDAWNELLTTLLSCTAPVDVSNRKVIGPSDTKLVLCSTFPEVEQPEDVFEQFFTNCFKFRSKGTLALKLPTWHLNPTLDANYYDQMRRVCGDSRFFSDYAARCKYASPLWRLTYE